MQKMGMEDTKEYSELSKVYEKLKEEMGYVADNIDRIVEGRL
jgi:hypothetical protein